ncbi:tetratricopeptide repeat protein [Agriterribacter sp.]|uniref:tetratricopeptide repeat protein n=1 Tax=Agriterribacter sp. TaxID=2821509 RepID=UPI002D152207|nr:tetratricopeptide repeat protein [Agriterribacter sp.]HRO44748.1 tetratricopeptide repeat protein [Agriterribacter sp.]HRQ16421.1 tetratricopeptide repeat protein [Agriterribacter sp.]
MQDNSYRNERDEMRDLLRQFENLRTGMSHGFLEEDAFEKIIDYFDDKDDIAGALEAAELGVGQFPYSASLMVKKADLLIATRKYNDALEILEKAEILDSSDIDIYILKTDVFLALDEHEKAVGLLEEAISLFEGENRINLLFELADVYDDYEEFDKVFDCLVHILEYEPNNEEALYKICFWTDFTGRSEESIRLHQHIINEYPYNELAWFNLGAAYQGLKLFEKSIDAYKYALAINEKFDYAYRNMADAYIRLRKYRDAIESLEKVIELARPEDVIYEAIGHCYDRLKQYAQARFYYKKASHLNSDDSKLYYKIACTYINELSFSKAVQYLESAMRIHRMQPEYNLAMGECLLELGNIKDAIIHFSNVVKAKPRGIAGWEALIRCLYKEDFLEEATEQIDNAQQVAGDKPLFLFYQSAVLFAMGKSKEALLILQKAMERAPRLLKKFIELNPTILQNQQVVDLIAYYKRKRSI